MFTGIIEGTGIIKSTVKITDTKRNADSRIGIDLGKLNRGSQVGDSVSVNGACLTITRIMKNIAYFEVVKETIKRTSLGMLQIGDYVNLERSLRLNDRIEGHIVLGHIDGVGRIEDIVKNPSGTKLLIKVNKEIAKFLVSKGSVAVDGISFTVVDISKNNFSIALVPHTLSITTFKSKSKGDKVNIEVDILSKYVAKFLPR
ncbi:MAG: riboflavin synthase [Thaumarchaeota archaeon]|nr:MAG: riboflavin synthase [Nitrososphaerota archaeon]TLX90845.1 MAG: riboflavin synthase [Nitrososphaerota archaeon]